MKSCLRCEHYFSTFDPQRPRGCRLYNMKTAAFPSQIVKQESGHDCLGFKEKKQAVKKENPKKVTRA